MKPNRTMSRRTLMKTTALAVAGVAVPLDAVHAKNGPSYKRLPRWRGFNLLEKFMMPNNARFLETDFAWIKELGFDFARLPMDYRCWTDPDDWTQIKEDVLKEIDEAVGFGRKHDVHVCLNFHRAPGYTVAQPGEAKNLWKDGEALRVCALHWSRFAERYAGIPNDALSFNLFNEPAMVAPDDHRRVVAAVLEGIRKHDPDRLVICDGRAGGRIPPAELKGLNVAAATRGYEPMQLTHYKAEWVEGADKYPEPAYPLTRGNTTCDRASLEKSAIKPWKTFESEGFGVMVGEFGAYNKTPHKVVLDWMRDCLSLWHKAGWGFALWNFRGSFGILDSARADVVYEDWRGHKMDRAMLELLGEFDGKQ
ncbi:MAG TPA: cellulase family glycosylhydrolase [Candidatus Hydrogenedentes bacterium]|nr:cellulase family glycosylhydrolase [Candidatus Hydrogenedentota bacterium]HOV75079.1 cellulase family glycosylhydrolase [Candidatus Hydrogenedentota bacterium]HPC17980.1 cellulase family glycosylhydrolase [Candidatus Hydrogenedentota bacterium]HRT21675.1 cellulase family glycosylhydrolase [Candidatus Hydrogenedentota bacterium]HRT66449.1 cellulase family glycosylhydrolase [Candidatus Hydrogenedentota bacterium]